MSLAMEFDFEARECRAIAPDLAAQSCSSGRACWVDLDATDEAPTRAVLRQLGVDERVLDHVLAREDTSSYEVYDNCLHVAATAVHLNGEDLSLSRLDVIMTSAFVVTLRRGHVRAIDRVQKSCRRDFEKFAQTIGFITFEIFDFMTDEYRRTIREIEGQVEQFQARIFGSVDDEIFNHVAHAIRNLLTFRAVLIASRDMLHQLSTRKSTFISESTQPFLENIVNAQERLSSDLTVAREILTETLDLYMSIVSHRTNRVVTRLTTLSVIFLPLTFLCGVYGMNFKYEPELQWKYGYWGFWFVVAAITAALIFIMKRRKWL